MVSFVGAARRPLALCVLVVFAGCSGEVSDDRPRQAVEGTVTLNGQPLGNGTIEFMPTDPQTGVPAHGVITAGKFTIPREEGPVPGGYKVSISSSGEAPVAPTTPGTEELPGAAPPLAKELIPPQYNAETTLNAEVKAGAPNKFDFTLQGPTKK